MPVKMQPEELDFWRELLAPFCDHELSFTKRGGKELTYIDKRAIENRLDSVCGPAGWYPEYEATQRGYKCRLYIQVPCRDENGSLVLGWRHKEDGAGFEEMGVTNKQTGEFEYDVDNDEKSGYTNALRRAAQDAWGIGRYLYQKGIPSFLDPNATAPVAPAAPAAPRTPTRAESAPPSEKPARSSDAPAQGGQRLNLPKPGPAVFAWAKEQESVFETKVIDGMLSQAEEQGWGRTFKDWNQAQVNTICLGVVKFLRELPTYKNQYEYLFPGGVPDPKIPTQKGSGPNTPAPAPGVNIADLRKALVDRMKALLAKQMGREPEIAEVKKVFGVVAAHAQNGQGHTGEVPESLSKMDDIVWLNNCIKLVEFQIENAKPFTAAEEESDDIPF